MSEGAPRRVAADVGTNGLKFLVIAFCWLDSTVSTAPLPALAGWLEPLLEPFELWELEVEFETPPHAANAAAAASAQHAALSVLYVLLRSIERAPPDTNVVSICGGPLLGSAGRGLTTKAGHAPPGEAGGA